MSKAMHVKSKSYFDWNQQFINAHSPEVKEDVAVYKPKKVNSLGIYEENFTDFLKEWKNKNNL